MNRAEFKALLLRRRAELLTIEATAQRSARTVELDQSRVGRLSRMDALQSQAMSRATHERLASELRQIAVALARIEDEDYGYCDECGEEIAEQRLRIDPAARYCVRCARKAEQKR